MRVAEVDLYVNNCNKEAIEHLSFDYCYYLGQCLGFGTFVCYSTKVLESKTLEYSSEILQSIE